MRCTAGVLSLPQPISLSIPVHGEHHDLLLSVLSPSLSLSLSLAFHETWDILSEEAEAENSGSETLNHARHASPSPIIISFH